MKNHQSTTITPLKLPSLLNWFVARKSQQEDSQIYRLRLFQITTFSVFFIHSFVNFLSGLIYSYFITAITCGFILVARHFIEKGKPKIAHTILLLTLNACVLSLSLLEGLQAGAYMFFFAILISFTFITNLSERHELFFCYFITSFILIIALVFAPSQGQPQQHHAINYTFHFAYNLAVSFFVIGWISLILLKESHRKELILQNDQLFLDSIFNHSEHAKFVVNTQTGFIYECNTTSLEIFAGKTKASLCERPASSLFLEFQTPKGELLHEMLKDAHYRWEGELTCVRLDGSTFDGQVSFIPLHFQGDNFKSISIEDITKKKVLVQELQQAKEKAEQLAVAKSLFLSNMSHELRTPLNGIIGSVNLLLQEMYLPSQKESLDVLRYSSEHMLSLINDILDFGKLEAGKIKIENKPVKLSELLSKIESIFKPQFESKQLPLIVKCEVDNETEVLTDYMRLYQVLTNLLSNALKFTDVGMVKLALAPTEIKSDFLTIRFSVSDTGIGISEQKQKLIFEEFTQADLRTTRKYGGTGLGLAISQRLVGIMGGELKVESKYGMGSNFYFDLRLPLSTRRKRVYVNQTNEFRTSIREGIRVLVAEDNAVNMKITTRFLDKWGVEYAKAANGVEAIKLFQQQKFDVLLLDLEMPEIDGYKALEEIRKLDQDIPAIAFTAAVFDNMRRHLNAAGFSDYVQKPFRPEDLHDKLAQYSRSVNT